MSLTATGCGRLESPLVRLVELIIGQFMCVRFYQHTLGKAEICKLR